MAKLQQTRMGTASTEYARDSNKFKTNLNSEPNQILYIAKKCQNLFYYVKFLKNMRDARDQYETPFQKISSESESGCARAGLRIFIKYSSRNPFYLLSNP